MVYCSSTHSGCIDGKRDARGSAMVTVLKDCYSLGNICSKGKMIGRAFVLQAIAIIIMLRGAFCALYSVSAYPPREVETELDVVGVCSVSGSLKWYLSPMNAAMLYSAILMRCTCIVAISARGHLEFNAFR